jgi:eukaryotic translation initiation factor 2C
VTSIVYSWDQYAAKYAAMSGIQQPRQEIIEDFRQYVKSAISSFVQANGARIPASIFFFRDGVSEGEYQTVSKHERDELQGMFSIVFYDSNTRMKIF